MQASVSLYPTTGTSNDYAYSRHPVDAGDRKVLAFALETGREFQPPFDEGLNIMNEVAAGLIEFCVSCLCIAREVVRGTALARKLGAMREFRNDLASTRAGRAYARLLDTHSAELLSLAQEEPRLRKAAVELMESVLDVVQSRKNEEPLVFKEDVIRSSEELLEYAEEKASPELRRTIRRLRGDLKYFANRSVMDGLKLASDRTNDP
jgi:hypothetical protein